MDLKYNWIYLKFDLILNILLNFTNTKYIFNNFYKTIFLNRPYYSEHNSEIELTTVLQATQLSRQSYTCILAGTL